MKNLFLAVLIAVFCSGCIAYAGVPTTSVVYANPSPTVVVATAPVRVYFEGVWLHYRNSAYHRYHNNTWIVAQRVPQHVERYHQHRVIRQHRHVRHVRRQR